MNPTTRSPQPPLTRSVEDYLKSVFHLTSQGGFATTSDIAEMLEVAPPSVSGMMKRLSETGLIEHVPYRGVQLTSQGRRAALQMIRRHRILESYLTSKLGYDWGDVHVEAEQLEHAVSEKLIERMADALGEPRYDPHGAPIPTAAGEIEDFIMAHAPAFIDRIEAEARSNGRFKEALAGVWIMRLQPDLFDRVEKAAGVPLRRL